jgi:transmembrane 9 superfamily protein 1
MALMRLCILVAALLVCVLSEGKHYKEGEKVTVFVNKVGPYFNPQETYHYYSLPVCRPVTVQHASLTLGEVLAGDRKAVSDYSIGFTESFDQRTLCTVELHQAELDMLREAIEDLYYFEFVFDDLPIRGFIGHLEEGPFLPHRHKVSLWTHLLFTFEYNGDQVISANVSTMGVNPMLLDDAELPLKVTFTYSAKWFKTSVKYSERSTKQEVFFPKTLEIHWLSIINSVVLVCLLLGFVILILLRVLRNDFARYNVVDDESEALDQDDYGWKIISTDVFRFPPHKSLLAAILGLWLAPPPSV